MNSRSGWIGGLCVLVAIGWGGCRPFKAGAPQGFAPFEPCWSVGGEFKAVSPEGVLFRVRAEDNDPKADLAFWKEAFKKRMLDVGYVFVSEGDLQATGTPGSLLELAAPVGQEDWKYFLALFVVKGDLVLAEAAGEVRKFESHRAAILEAFRQIQL